ncbi:MAG TPA: hypothetical protein VFT74_14685 [Isosphaeraceae bacterium]|nr:hypothetical protein [Isosphaeraceae bacterium]
MPRELRALLAALTYEDRLRKFRYAHEREPHNDAEMERFVQNVARELYNAGIDEWPENDEELS